MQDYYNHNVFNKTQSQLVQLSFVGTMLVGTISLSSPFTQMAVSRFGLRTVMLIGAIFIALALEIAAQSTEVQILTF
jgi:hypothetical protein